MNFASNDVSLYTIYINGSNILTEASKTDQNLTLTSYPVCSCASHNISVSATNRCGQEGQRSSIILTSNQEPESLPERECDSTITQPTSPIDVPTGDSCKFA